MKRFLICGKAASGKDHLKKACKEHKLQCDVSLTTRPCREGEKDGVDYHFVSTTTFREQEEDGNIFLKSKFNDWRYGILQSSWEQSRVFVFTPDLLKALSPEERKASFVLFLDVDSKTRKARLGKRNDADSVARRMLADEEQFKEFQDFDKRITDPSFDPATLLQECGILEKFKCK